VSGSPGTDGTPASDAVTVGTAAEVDELDDVETDGLPVAVCVGVAVDVAVDDPLEESVADVVDRVDDANALEEPDGAGPAGDTELIGDAVAAADATAQIWSASRM
jgi:hypothetical protein